jgi:hypothetical protein
MKQAANTSICRTVFHAKAKVERLEQFVKVTFLENSQVTLKDQQELAAIYIDLTDNTPMPFLYDAEHGVDITKEAREYGARMAGLLPVSSIAIIVRSVAYKLLADFYFKFHKPQMPYKVFKSEEAAMEWMISIISTKDKLLVDPS